MLVGQSRRHAPPRRTLQKTSLDQEGLVHILDSILFLANGSSQRLHADGAARKLVDHRKKQHGIHFVEA